jgi:iron complex outermembrane receptor protein
MPAPLRLNPIALALAALVLPTPAPAQQFEQQLPEVKVRAAPEERPAEGYVAPESATGTKTDTPLVEIPQSISVTTRERMDDQKVQTVDDALRYAAGVVSQYFGFDHRIDAVKIRGFELRTQGGYFLDGMRLPAMNFNVWHTEPYSLERVEVLRGPASVLYGQGRPGGLINQVSKRPPSVPLREVELTAGTFTRKQIAADLGGPLDSEGTLTYRLTALGRDSNTQVDFVKDDRAFFAPALTWRPSADTTLTLLATVQDDRLGSSFAFLPGQGTLLPNANGKIPRNRFTGEPNFEQVDFAQQSLGYLIEHRLSDVWTLRQNLRYGRMESDWKIVFPLGLAADLRTFNRASFTVDGTLDAFNVDNQAQAKFTTGRFSHTLLFGVDYLRHKSDDRLGFGAAPSLDAFDPVYGQPVANPPLFQDSLQTQTQAGLYVHDQIKLDRWVLSLGGRQDRAKLVTRNRLAGTDARQADNAFTYRAGLVYLSELGIAPYVSYSESFEPTAGTDFSGNPFEPTRGKQYEAGVKYQSKGSSSFITLSAFELTQENVLTPDSANAFFSVQTGEAQSRGLELEGVADLTKSLKLFGSYTYTDTEITKSTDVNLGKRIPVVPKHMASLWADYRLRGGAWAGLSLGAGVRYVGSSPADAANTISNPSYALLDAAVRYHFDRHWRLAVNASNLLDKEYALCTDPVATCNYGQARTVLATLRYQW